ncbi:methyltransferase family protein [Planctomyces sp. SH-PL14]|uniref:methyltransferase family protein n=1 Tax=Planctomyces sp. SH-PL14 TaxID=1632864 RepID=UPI00078DBF64|nr:isoprenylcysteine carboxylmethyltransferase family protein [Planctomyces sp. SH-PL14]AMV20688.1 Isoprenylcysteine carboxyl methyltransferase (ICMT) family protein [Planctomyces sp. SH-PL14]
MQSLRDSWCYTRRLQLTVVLITFAWIGALASPSWVAEGSSADRLTDAVAWSFLFSGVGLRLWATCAIAGRKGWRLVTEGPYAYCRNPLYVGTFCLGIALALLIKSALFATVVGFLILFYVLGVVPAEERFLRRNLGDAYLRYCRDVPAWFPRFNAPLAAEPGLLDVRWSSLRAETLQSACWCTLGVLADVTTQIHLTDVLPSFAYFV